MKTSKDQIKKATISRRITGSNYITGANYFNFTYQISKNESYTKDRDQNVLHNIGIESERIGYASTKEEFVELVLNHINSRKIYNYYYDGQPISTIRFLSSVPKNWENKVDKNGEYSWGYYRAIEIDTEK